MKGIMKGQVTALSDADMAAMADEIVGGGASAPAAAAPAAAPAAKKIVDINAKASDSSRISKEDLGAKKEIGEEMLGLRKATLYNENVKPAEGNFKRATAGSSDRFKRAFVNAPPMIPHDVEGMLPIVTANNACLGCHMPEVAPSVKATAIPASHFANFRPATGMAADGKITKEGKSVDNTSDFITVTKKMDKLNHARFNCSQCHAPQANIDALVGNTFTPDFGNDEQKSKSNLLDVINAGVK
jgi:cytochrome c-type protein NapB